MRPLSMLLLSTAVGLTACGFDDGSRQSAATGDDVHDACDCEKIEGSDIGVVGLELTVAHITVQFTGWTEKSDSPEEYVGFELAATGDGTPTFYVKAGDEVFSDTGLAWSHPAGQSGPDAHGISYVEVCDTHPPGGDGDGDGDCNDPDGCDNGGDDPPYVE